jgi:chemotaxis protein histidine kinase CheA
MNELPLPSTALEPELQDSAYQLFIQEAVALFQCIETDLHVLTQSLKVEDLQPIIQALQLVRSGAEQLGLFDFQNAVGRLETLCLMLQPQNRAELDLLCQANQTLKLSLLAHVQRIPLTGDINCMAAQAVLEQLETQRQVQPLPPPPPPQGALPPASAAQLTALALRAEVEEALDQMERLLVAPPTPTLATDLKTCIEGLRDLGEMSDLAEFVAISQTALTSLNTSPDSAPTIGPITLTGYRAVYEQLTSVKAFSADPASHSVDVPFEQPHVVATQTLAIADAFVWQIEGNIFILPSRYMLEILIPRTGQVDDTQTPWTLSWRSQTIPVYALAQFVDHPDLYRPGNVTRDLKQQSPLLVVKRSHETCALQVEIERLITASTIELTPSPQENWPMYYLGSTDMEDRLNVIDVEILLDQALRRR